MERLTIVQELRWEPLRHPPEGVRDSEVEFIRKKMNHPMQGEALGPIIKERAKWLDIPLRSLQGSSTANTVTSTTTTSASARSSDVTASSISASSSAATSATTPTPVTSAQTSATNAPGFDANAAAPKPDVVSIADLGASHLVEPAPSQTPLSPALDDARRASPFKSNRLRNNTRLARRTPKASQPGRPATTLADHFLDGLSDRLSQSLIRLALPTDEVQRATIDALVQQLEIARSTLQAQTEANRLPAKRRATRGGRESADHPRRATGAASHQPPADQAHADQPPAADQGLSAPDSSAIAKAYYEFLSIAGQKGGNKKSGDAARSSSDEAALTDAWCRVSNEAWMFLASKLTGEDDKGDKDHKEGQDDKDDKGHKEEKEDKEKKEDAHAGPSAHDHAGPSDEPRPLLFHNTSTKSTTSHSEVPRDNTRPDIQSLRHPRVQPLKLPGRRKKKEQDGQASSSPQKDDVQWGPADDDDKATRVALTSEEVKLDANEDLGRKVTSQVLRNMFQCFLHQEGLTRTFHLTITGPKVRLWMCDTASVSTSRAYDASSPQDIVRIAQVLAFMCSKPDEVAPAWKPFKGMVLTCNNPAVYSQVDPQAAHNKPAVDSQADPQADPQATETAQPKLLCEDKGLRTFYVVDRPAFIPPHDTNLWGRHTACWALQAIELPDGLLQGAPEDRASAAFAEWANDVAAAYAQEHPHQVFTMVLKTGWLPVYLRTHEYKMLRLLHKGENEDDTDKPGHDDFPWALGIVDTALLPIPDPTPTARLPRMPRRQGENLDVSEQTVFVALAQRCQRGFDVTDVTPAQPLTNSQLLRILRDLLRLLKRVSEKGIHYRDVNLGNFVLKQAFEQLWSDPKASVLMLLDFGNSRYLDEHRGGSDSARAMGVPLGADDALSVCALFVSHRSLECAEQLKIASALRADAVRAEPSSQAFLLRLADKALRTAELYEHRFADDCESAMLAYLWLVYVWARDPGLRSRIERLCDMLNLKGTKTTLWCQNWDLELGRIMGFIPEGTAWLELLTALNGEIRNCQKDLHDNHLVRGRIVPMECTCYDKCDDLLDGFIQRFAGQSSPAQHAQGAPMDQPLA